MFTWVFYLKKICMKQQFKLQNKSNKTFIQLLNDNSFIYTQDSYEQNNKSFFEKLVVFFLPLKYIFQVHSPDSVFPLFLDLITVFIILIDFFLIPLSLSFTEVQESPELDLYSWGVTGFFCFILIQSFSIAVYIKGQLVYDRMVIAKQYFKSYFFIDLIATIPFDSFINTNSGSSGSTSLLRIFRFFRILRTLKLLQGQKLKNLMD